MELIDEVIFRPGLIQTDWEGRAVELDRRLKSAQSDPVKREAERLLPSANSCGKYLGRLAERHPERVIKYPGSGGIRRWKIMAPQSGEFGVGSVSEPSECGVGSKPLPGSAADTLLKRLRETNSQTRTLTPPNNVLDVRFPNIQSSDSLVAAEAMVAKCMEAYSITPVNPEVVDQQPCSQPDGCPELVDIVKEVRIKG